MNQEIKKSKSTSRAIQYTARPTSLSPDYHELQKRGFVRNVGVFLAICRKYLGPDIDMFKKTEDQTAHYLTKNKVAQAAEESKKTEVKKLKNELQKPLSLLTESEAAKRIVKAVKAFDRAVKNIEKTGGRINLDTQKLLKCWSVGNKEFHDDSLVMTLAKKMSADPEKVSKIRDTSAIFQKIKEKGNLPTPAAKAFKIFRLANDDSTSISDIAVVVETDPAIAAQILKIANSAFYKSLNTITSVQDAITRLGLTMVKRISLGLSLISDNKKGLCKEFDYEMFWSESLARAVLARNLNQIRNTAFNSDETFTVGLLCQIGRLAFAGMYPEEYAAILRKFNADNPSQLIENERKVFGIDHNELAAEMMADWNLPDIFCNAVRLQDSCDENEDLVPGSPEYELVGLLKCPMKFSVVLTHSNAKLEFLKSILKQAKAQGIGTDFFKSKFDAIVNEWRDIGAFLGVETRKVLTWKDIYAQIK